MSIPSYCEQIPRPLRYMLAPCIGESIAGGVKTEQRAAVPLPQSFHLWIIGAIVMIVLFQYAPKLAGWLLLALVVGYALGPGSRYFTSGTSQIGGTFP